AGSDERKESIERAYNRSFRGYVEPDFGNEPIQIARWTKDGVKLHPHQTSGARRVLANRSGMLAFDVGVGKTYTGIAVVARARQEGWCKRPVLLVPNSIAWKWAADLRRVLPDYRVAVIGSKKKRLKVGAKKGQVTSETDSPKERAEKWTRFQAGEYDVVILTYTALARTRMNEEVLRQYAEGIEAIQREVKLKRRNAKKRQKSAEDNDNINLSERQEAVLKEGVGAWVAEKMEIPESWEYDPGIAWDDLGIDMLVVDEAQNFKNLYMPELREGGVPRFMGNAGEGSNRAWQLDFRCAAVRRHTGGTGVVLLSATPAKNSPLEFYNLLQLIDPKVWSRMGIRNPEQFIDRYIKTELREVIGSDMDVTTKSAVVGFKNLHELREVIFRYADFKTAEDVGLVLPEVTPNFIQVEMNAEQNRKYDLYAEQIENILQEKTGLHGKGQILGLLARMALVSIHQSLDEGYDWKTAAKAHVDPESPKFSALAKRVKAAQGCGHIVFCDNVAAHRWIVQTLVKRGVPEKRIAVLNAIVAKNTADRQRIALEFNGSDEIDPKYDVVIANAVAYEGIDLQRRTCEIHHIDLPWEPATLQQRNGRGVRQGNTLESIAVNYYFAKRSQDGLRFDLIKGKHGWMKALLKSQDRDTNNPAAQLEMGPDEILLMISRNPEKTKALIDAAKAKAAAERRAKMAKNAASLLITANARFRRAEYKEGEEAAMLRAEGEELLKHLSQVDPEAWPWYKWAVLVRERNMLVDRNGGPIAVEGMRFAVPSKYRDDLEYFELGRIVGSTIGYRALGDLTWSKIEIERFAGLEIKPEHYDAVFPEKPDQDALDKLRPRKRTFFGYGYGLTGVTGWGQASDTFLRWIWQQMGDEIAQYFAEEDDWTARQQYIPVLSQSQVVIAQGKKVLDGRLFASTQEGWMSFLEHLRRGDVSPNLKLSELSKAASYWWGREIPRNTLKTQETE
ncbi:MAG: DEAD/DEAH box helicase, partial [Myxococcales bacterium]|nr:DEAD/DEAH box helicase [Myxococcales bacterium]